MRFKDFTSIVINEARDHGILRQFVLACGRAVSIRLHEEYPHHVNIPYECLSRQIISGTNHRVPLYINPAEEPKVSVAIAGGLYASHLSHADMDLKGMDASVVRTRLPLDMDMKVCLARGEERLKWFFFNQDSPFHTNNPNLPKIIVAHSTSGPLLQKIIAENPDIGKGMIDAAIVVNPFFEIANVGKLANSLFEHCARAWPQASVNMGPAGALRFLSGSLREKYLFTRSPTYEQFDALRSEAARIQTGLESPDAASASFPQIFLLGQNDTTANWRTGLQVADIVGAETRIVKGGHWPLEPGSEGLHVIESVIRDVIARHQKGAAPAPVLAV